MNEPDETLICSFDPSLSPGRETPQTHYRFDATIEGPFTLSKQLQMTQALQIPAGAYTETIDAKVFLWANKLVL